jgi:UV DNA damage repair endonuclease
MNEASNRPLKNEMERVIQILCRRTKNNPGRDWVCHDQHFIATSSPEPAVGAASIRQIACKKNTPDNLQIDRKQT